MGRESSDEMSSLASDVMRRPRVDAPVSASLYNSLLADAKRLAGSVMANDETPGRRIVRALKGALGGGRSEPNARR